MTSEQQQVATGPESKTRVVTVTVDGQKHQVPAGKYLVSNFKSLVGVPSAKELDEVIGGKLTPLADDATINIEHAEVFISHERTGGAS